MLQWRCIKMSTLRTSDHADCHGLDRFRQRFRDRRSRTSNNMALTVIYFPGTIYIGLNPFMMIRMDRRPPGRGDRHQAKDDMSFTGSFSPGPTPMRRHAARR
jgi:hypothetical protein